MLYVYEALKQSEILTHVRLHTIKEYKRWRYMSEFPVNIYWERELHPRPCLLNYSTTISWPRRCKFFCFRDSKPSKQIGHLNLDLQYFSCCFMEPPTKLLHIVHVFTSLLKDQNCRCTSPKWRVCLSDNIHVNLSQQLFDSLWRARTSYLPSGAE